MEDTTCFGDEFTRMSPDEFFRTVQAELTADTIKAKFGSLEIIGNGGLVHGSEVLVDGQPFPFGIRSLVLTGEVGGIWTATVEFLPHVTS